MIQHLSVGGSFVAVVVPAFILEVHHEYPPEIVDLYVQILWVGLVAMVPGLIIGFMLGKGRKTNFSFDVMGNAAFEQRVMGITKTLMILGISGLVISYMVMGFIPLFAADPISAKLFRGPYQEPYLRVAVLYRASFFILSTIIPIAFIIWYKTKKLFFLVSVLAVVVLMAMSLARSGAFSGIVLAVAIIMSFKSRFTFVLLMLLLVGVFIGSAFFYYIVGIRTFDENVKYLWDTDSKAGFYMATGINPKNGKKITERVTPLKIKSEIDFPSPWQVKFQLQEFWKVPTIILKVLNPQKMSP